MSADKELDFAPASFSQKKTYETPTLIVHGSASDITKSTFKVGSGDLWMQAHNLPDVLAQS